MTQENKPVRVDAGNVKDGMQKVNKEEKKREETSTTERVVTGEGKEKQAPRSCEKTNAGTAVIGKANSQKEVVGEEVCKPQISFDGKKSRRRESRDAQDSRIHANKGESSQAPSKCESSSLHSGKLSLDSSTEAQLDATPASTILVEDSSDSESPRHSIKSSPDSSTARTSTCTTNTSSGKEERSDCFERRKRATTDGDEKGENDTRADRRVKVYVLNADGNWDDSTTGYVSLCKEKPRGAKETDLCIRVTSEDTGAEALHYRVKIFQEACYQQQGTTIITWAERRGDDVIFDRSNAAGEMALSFADPRECRDVWNEIKKAQTESMSLDPAFYQKRGSGPHGGLIVGPNGTLLDEELEISAAGAMNWANKNGDELFFTESSLNLLANSARGSDGYSDKDAAPVAIEITIPEPTHNQLPALAKLFGEQGPMHVPSVRHCIAGEFKSNNYIKRLLELFRECEDLEDLDGLRCLYHVFRGICFLGDAQILNEILTDGNFMTIVGALEYDPSHLPTIPQDSRAKEAAVKNLIPLKRHRTQLEERPAFRSVVDIQDKNILEKIHRNYRLMFIRDVVLPHTMDDISLGSFQGYLHMNNAEIIHHMIYNPGPLRDLFRQLQEHMRRDNQKQSEVEQNEVEKDQASSKKEEESINDFCSLLRFVMELLSLTRFIQHQERVITINQLLSRRLFEVLYFAMGKSELTVKHVATDIILELARNDFGLTKLHRFSIGKDPEVQPVAMVGGNQNGDEVVQGSAVTDLEESESSFDIQEREAGAAEASKPKAEAGNTDCKAPVVEEAEQPNEQEKNEQEDPADNTEKLLESLFDLVCHGRDTGLVLQANEIIRQMTNPEAISISTEKEPFMKFLYSKCIPRLLRPLKETNVKSEDHVCSPYFSNLSYVCNLISFFISNHGYRAKYFVLGNDLIARVLKLVSHPVGDVRLSAIGVLRATIGSRDDAYDRYLKSNDLLKPVMDLFVKNSYRDNIVNSVVLEMVSFCAREHRELLLSVIVENYGDELQPSMKHSQVFEEAKKTLQALRSNEALPTKEQPQIPMISRAPPGFTYAQNDTLTVFPMHDEAEEYFTNSDVSDILDGKDSDPRNRRMSLSSGNPFGGTLPLSNYDEMSVFDDGPLSMQGGRLDNSKLINSASSGVVGSSTDGTKERFISGEERNLTTQSDDALALAFPDYYASLSQNGSPRLRDDRGSSVNTKRRRPANEIRFENSAKAEKSPSAQTRTKEEEVSVDKEEERDPSPPKRRRLSAQRNVEADVDESLEGTRESQRGDNTAVGEQQTHEVALQTSLAVGET